MLVPALVLVNSVVVVGLQPVRGAYSNVLQSYNVIAFELLPFMNYSVITYEENTVSLLKKFCGGLNLPYKLRKQKEKRFVGSRSV